MRTIIYLMLAAGLLALSACGNGSAGGGGTSNSDHARVKFGFPF